MGIFGWDLPPGCSINDIPGNRPEDMEAEAIQDAFWTKMEEKYPDLLKQYNEDVHKDNEASTPRYYVDEFISYAIDFGIEVGRQMEKEAEHDRKCDEQMEKLDRKQLL